MDGHERRLLHPRGRTYTGELLVSGSAGVTWGSALLDRPGRHRATVRLSKGAGTPVGWPDVLGLAVRVHDDDGGGDADLLLSSTSRLPVARHLPLPVFTFAGAAFGSLLSYRAGPAGATSRVYLGAIGRRAPEGVRFQLFARSVLRGWRPFGELWLERALPAAADAAIAFDPAVRRRQDLHVGGAVQRLRAAAYRTSRRRSAPD